MLCPVCKEARIDVKCSQDTQGVPPYTTHITIVDEVQQDECNCELTPEHLNNLICDDPYDEDY
jgi:hypothetical protein